MALLCREGPQIQQLKAAITEYKQTETMSVDEYYTKLLGLYDELTRLKPLPHYECKKCCGIALRLSKDRDEEIFHQFLIGLDSSKYSAVRTNLLSQQPLGDLNRAHQTLIQEEQSRATGHGRGSLESVQAFHVQAGRGRVKYERGDKSKLMCTHYKQRGHEVSTCFKIHGNPEWYEERLHARNTTRLGGGVGTSPNSAAGAVAAAGAASGTEGACAHVVTNGTFNVAGGGGTPLASLTPDQVQVPMNLINKEQSTGESNAGEKFSMECIIDIGASHHINGSLSCLVNVRVISGCPVGLPNGHSVLAS